MNFYEAWWWLHDHPINLRPEPKLKGPTKEIPVGLYELDIHVAKVNPATNEIDAHKKLNTETQIWLEFGPFVNYAEGFPEFSPNYHRSHDIRLDCGGKTFEEAIIKLAELVKKNYGDYDYD
jgi:hypothetical protein